MSGRSNVLPSGSRCENDPVNRDARRKEYIQSVGAVDLATAIAATAIITAVVVLCLWYVHERQGPDAHAGRWPRPPSLIIDAGRKSPPHRTTIDTSSVAYRLGYGDVYYTAANIDFLRQTDASDCRCQFSGTPPWGMAGVTPTDPDTNVYMQTPRSEWHDLANHRIKDETNAIRAECPAIHISELGSGNRRLMGDWQDNIAGFEQALQDIAAGRAPWATATYPSYAICGPRSGD
jgi:hypothetical protein